MLNGATAEESQGLEKWRNFRRMAEGRIRDSCDDKVDQSVDVKIE